MYYQRNLPHWHPSGKDLFVTWRLSGSLPLLAMRELRQRSLPPGKHFREFDRYLESTTSGPFWLKNARIAGLVVSALKDTESQGLCILHAYVVMPNHVHVLLEPRAELRNITKLVKGNTARTANAILDRIGQSFWQDESFDHWIRDSAQFERVRAYIQRNPVLAGLVPQSQDWPWSSAHC